MQVSVESTGNLERRINFSLPAEQLESTVSGRLREIARTTRINGFRPGKVPAKVIEQRFGAQVRGEALDGLLRETFDAAVRTGKRSLEALGMPKTKAEEIGDLFFCLDRNSVAAMAKVYQPGMARFDNKEMMRVAHLEDTKAETAIQAALRGEVVAWPEK